MWLSIGVGIGAALLFVALAFLAGVVIGALSAGSATEPY